MNRIIKKMLQKRNFKEAIEKLDIFLLRNRYETKEFLDDDYYLLSIKSFCLSKLKRYKLAYDILDRHIMTKELGLMKPEICFIVNDTLINLGCFYKSYQILSQYELKDKILLNKYEGIKIMNKLSLNNVNRRTNVFINPESIDNVESFISYDLVYKDRYLNYQYLFKNIYKMTYEEIFRFINKFLITNNFNSNQKDTDLFDIHAILDNLSKNERIEILLLIIRKLYRDTFCYLLLFLIDITLDIYIDLIKNKYEILCFSLEHNRNNQITNYDPLDGQYYELLHFLDKILERHKNALNDVLINDFCECNDKIPFTSVNMENIVLKYKILTNDKIYGYTAT